MSKFSRQYLVLIPYWIFFIVLEVLMIYFFVISIRARTERDKYDAALDRVQDMQVCGDNYSIVNLLYIKNTEQEVSNTFVGHTLSNLAAFILIAVFSALGCAIFVYKTKKALKNTVKVKPVEVVPVLNIKRAEEDPEAEGLHQSPGAF